MVGTGFGCCHRVVHAVDAINPFGEVETEGGIPAGVVEMAAHRTAGGHDASGCDSRTVEKGFDLGEKAEKHRDHLCVVVQVSTWWCSREDGSPQGHHGEQVECQCWHCRSTSSPEGLEEESW